MPKVSTLDMVFCPRTPPSLMSVKTTESPSLVLFLSLLFPFLSFPFFFFFFFFTPFLFPFSYPSPPPPPPKKKKKGPTGNSMRMMASKSAAKILMTDANVPVVPGYHGEGQDIEQLQEEAEKIGFPVLIKAVLGGGGKVFFFFFPTLFFFFFFLTSFPRV